MQMQDKIITFLKDSEAYISGEDISRKLNISRTAIWKNIEELRKTGYDIVAVPHLGYKLNSIPDKLFPREVLSGLKTNSFGKKFIHFDTIVSTMDYAFKLGLEGEKEGALVCAEGQSKGRGRLERHWLSPKSKGIYMSLILRPQLSPADVAKITLLGAVGLCEAVHKITGLDVKIKWPNDLLVNDKKIAGILTELSAEVDRVRFVIIGIGINVNTPLRGLPENATSLKNELNHAVSRVELMQEILFSLERWYNTLNRKGFDPIIQRWRELSSTLGRRVSVGKLKGKAVDLDADGGLIIQKDSGDKVRCMTGDVVQV